MLHASSLHIRIENGAEFAFERSKLFYYDLMSLHTLI
ncbi:hypothetical protein DFP81_101474 [Marinomonas pollencensis]|uniref:Uncharacterized protein n=1 Tax=Marinomonas pollencensis TaxID=491954 RepID=A0A3E0DWL2_9GAMM|nr:hypothetical protein DFP81_101474 [Marinomonas pollencensis]